MGVIQGFRGPLAIGSRVTIDVRYDHPRISHDKYHGKEATVIEPRGTCSGLYLIECEGEQMICHRSWLYSLEEVG